MPSKPKNSGSGDANIIGEQRKSTSADGDQIFRFITNHAHVLQVISNDPTVRINDLAQEVGITERAARTIINELDVAGYLTKSRDGRRNRYQVHAALPLRHPRHRHHTVGDLIRFLNARPGSRRRIAASSLDHH